MVLPSSYVVLDVETTGLSTNDALTEVAAIRVVDGLESGRFHSLTNPGVPIPKLVTDITGITDEMVSDKPSNAEVANAFIGFAGDLPVVGHNVKFDIGFISRAAGGDVGLQSVDTLKLSRQMFMGLKSFKLANVYAHCVAGGAQEVAEEGSAHRAMYDVLMTRCVYEHMRSLCHEDDGVFRRKPMSRPAPRRRS